MTVAITTTRIQYAGTGSQTVFPYPFKVWVATELVVIVTDANGVETVKTLNVHYSVSGVGNDAGGNVTFGTAPLATEKVTLMRALPQKQETDYVENDPFPAVATENALDKLTMMVQELQEQAKRAPLLKRSSAYADLGLPDPEVTDRFLRWKSDLSGLENVSAVTAPNLVTQDMNIAGFVKNLPDGTLVGGKTITVNDFPPDFWVIVNEAATDQADDQQTNSVAYIAAQYAGANVGLLFKRGQTFTFAQNYTIPQNLQLAVQPGALLHAADTVTVTVKSTLLRNLFCQVFSWAGTGKFVLEGNPFVRPEWWGAKADGTTECAAALQKAFDACPNVRLGKGSYKLTDTSVLLNSTTVAMGYTFRGEGMETKLMLYGYTDKYAFHLNADASKNRVIDWPQGPRLVVGDMLVHGGNSTSASFLYARQCCVKVENIRFNYLYKGFYFEDYCDRLTLRDIHWTDPKANGQFFHLRQGDTLTIDGINIYPHNNNGCSINYSGGFRVSNIIGGIHKFEYCQGGTFENCHIEGDEVKIGNSTMTLRNNFFYNRNLPNGYAVLCDGNLGSYWHPHNHIVFENNVFSFVGMAAGDVRGYDIKIINPKGRDVYVFRNNVGNLAAPATEFISEKAGIVVYSDDAKLGPALQKFKGRVSGDLTLAYDDGYLHDWVAVVPGAREVQYSPAPTFDWSGEGVKPSNLPQGTYYYKMAWYNEVGHTTPSSQTQVTTSAPNKSIELTINGRQPDGFLRVWRGPSSGSYDRYVDIPLSGPHISLHDMGSTLSGYAWITSGVPSVPAANTTMHGIITARDKRQFWSSAAPSSAEFTGVVGDIVWNENPAVGQPKGWVCTVAGSPGTWVSLGNL